MICRFVLVCSKDLGAIICQMPDIYQQILLLLRSHYQVICTFRSNHWRCSVRKGNLRNFTKFTGKRLCHRPASLLKKRLWHKCFPVNFAKFLKTRFLQNISGRLLLYISWVMTEISWLMHESPVLKLHWLGVIKLF